jgi:hypothetical protein
MFKYQELIDNGFVEDGEWNDRYYLTKNGFDIVCHNGYVSRCNRRNLSGYGKNFETIKELDEAYKKWARDFIDKYEPKINAIKESLGEEVIPYGLPYCPMGDAEGVNANVEINGHVISVDELALYNKYIDYLKGNIKIRDFLDNYNTLDNYRRAKSIYERITN